MSFMGLALDLLGRVVGTFMNNLQKLSTLPKSKGKSIFRQSRFATSDFGRKVVRAHILTPAVEIEQK